MTDIWGQSLKHNALYAPKSIFSDHKWEMAKSYINITKVWYALSDNSYKFA